MQQLCTSIKDMTSGPSFCGAPAPCCSARHKIVRTSCHRERERRLKSSKERRRRFLATDTESTSFPAVQQLCPKNQSPCPTCLELLLWLCLMPCTTESRIQKHKWEWTGGAVVSTAASKQERKHLGDLMRPKWWTRDSLCVNVSLLAWKAERNESILNFFLII